jgi:hypothetical protein
MSRTVLFGPLTTTWTQPSSCTLPMAVSQSTGFDFRSFQTVLQGLTCTSYTLRACTTGTSYCSAVTTYESLIDAACFPSATVNPNNELGIFGFYSPGLVCPQSYTTACATTMGGTGDFEPFWPLTADETAIGCCPRSAR